MTTLLIITTLPDTESAHRLATDLVEAKLAACINILPSTTSVYRWQGKTETACEIPLLIKTRADRYPAVEAAIRSAHPYELPEIIAVNIDKGLPEYLNWVANESSPGSK
ncbi:divalent-cation tolerance protein CutA [Chitinivorax sp. B]|uniref:divalent-cation tolerance protein CutA n=1 Tax=Chitinivorax sp. B TaxID=2502235 RepID=UPI0010F7B9A3|nr:divalent-cation tolerance protein CutA [Chitinivorax sp. B]